MELDRRGVDARLAAPRAALVEAQADDRPETDGHAGPRERLADIEDAVRALDIVIARATPA